MRILKADDLNDIVRIDQGVTGRRREAYIRELVEEAMTDSAVRVSLVARENFGLLGFFYDAGFQHSQLLSFVKRVA